MFDDIFQMSDVYKVIASLIAGVILGLERELKDKTAGFRTIGIICISSTLFTLIGDRIGFDSGNRTQMAAYVVSGVGFIGAGAIFKDGFSISGLTTASLVWLGAAIGVSIGFGEYFSALIFLVSSSLIVIVIPYFMNRLLPSLSTMQIDITWLNDNVHKIANFEKEIGEHSNNFSYKKISTQNDKKFISYQVVVKNNKKAELFALLNNHTDIEEYTISYA